MACPAGNGLDVMGQEGVLAPAHPGGCFALACVRGVRVHWLGVMLSERKFIAGLCEGGPFAEVGVMVRVCSLGFRGWVQSRADRLLS